jgi:hypothetical protein
VVESISVMMAGPVTTFPARRAVRS